MILAVIALVVACMGLVIQFVSLSVFLEQLAAMKAMVHDEEIVAGEVHALRHDLAESEHNSDEDSVGKGEPGAN